MPIFFMLNFFLFACENFLTETPLTIKINESDSAHTWTNQGKTIVFYISDNKLSQTKTNNNELKINVSKTTVMPVLACEKISNINTNFNNCKLARGGVYPFDENNGKLVLSSKHKAQVAEVLLYLYKNNAAIDQINIYKLYQTIAKKSPHDMFDKSRFYSYISKNYLSYWSITPKKKYLISINDINQIWKSTDFWIDQLVPKIQENGTSHADINLYEGWWIFISEHNSSELLHIHVNNTGEYSVFQ